MGPVGSKICKTVLGERSETSTVNYADLGELTNPERKLVSLIGCYYYGRYNKCNHVIVVIVVVALNIIVIIISSDI